MELYRKELKLAVIKGLDESRGSSNVPIKLTHDTSDEYINYTEQIHIRYLFDNQLKEEILPTNDNGFYIPGKPLSHDGPIELAVHLINGDIELVTNELSFVVKNAPNGTTQVDPSEFTWQQLVDQYVNAKLDTFANKLDLSKFEETVNGSIENQNQNIESFKSEVNTSLSNQNTSINKTTSAQNSKITTLEGRMDTFTRLSGGSTTGDAELQDIRVGANGTTYDTAGNAVRGQYSQLKEDLDTLNQGGLNLKEDFIGQQVNEWLDKHPEATTTVQDGSLTEVKFTPSFRNEYNILKNGIINVKLYNVKGDGITNDTLAIQNILDTYVNNGNGNIAIYFPKGEYIIDNILISQTNGVHFYGDGVSATVLKCVNTSGTEENNIDFIKLSGVVAHCLFEKMSISNDGNEYNNGISSRCELYNGFETAGLWFSDFNDLIISGFRNDIFFKAKDPSSDIDVANQYLTFNRCRFFGANYSCFTAYGQLGQNSFNDCYFEKAKDTLKHYIYLKGYEGSNGSDHTEMRLNNCSFVSSTTEQSDLMFVSTGPCNIIFDCCWFENIKVPMINTELSYINLLFRNCLFILCVNNVFCNGIGNKINLLLDKCINNRSLYDNAFNDTINDACLFSIWERDTIGEVLVKTKKRPDTNFMLGISNYTFHAIKRIFKLSDVLYNKNGEIVLSILKHSSLSDDVTFVVFDDGTKYCPVPFNMKIKLDIYNKKIVSCVYSGMVKGSTEYINAVLSDKKKIYVGFQCIDTTLNKVVTWNGSSFV